jgi:hypothetical protein
MAGSRAGVAFTDAGALELKGLVDPVSAFEVAWEPGLLATTLRRFDEAESRFAAAAVHERVGAVAWLARTRLEWARMLLARSGPGDPERAREVLDQALASARTFGLANIEHRATQLLP